MLVQNNKCTELEKSLKRIPGLRLGNKAISIMYDKSLSVWLYPRDQRVLMPVGRCLDRRYGGQPWTLEVDITDIQENFICYHLQSKNFGHQAIEDSKKLSTMLNSFMDNEGVLKHFGLDKIFYQELLLDMKENREKNITKVLGNQ